MVKNPSAMQEIQEICVQSLGQEDHLEEVCIFAWIIPGTEEPGGLYSSWGPKEPDTTEATEHATFMLGRQKGKGFNSPGYISFLRVLCPTSVHKLISQPGVGRPLTAFSDFMLV